MGTEILSIETPQPRHRIDRWPERLAGRGVPAWTPRQALVHPLRGRPDRSLAPAHDRPLERLPPGQRGPLAAPRLAGGAHAGTRSFSSTGRAGADDRLAHPLRPSTGRARARHRGRGLRRGRLLRRLREDDPTRRIGDALLDQRILAGIGNLWKSEACLLAGVDPGAGQGEVSDDGGAGDRARCAPADAGIRARWLPGARAAGLRTRGPPLPALRHARPGPRAGRRQPHHLLVPGMPMVKRVGHKGADHVAPGNTVGELRGRAGARCRHDRVRRPAAARRPPGAGPRLRGRRRREPLTLDEGSTSSPARPTPASSSTWT